MYYKNRHKSESNLWTNAKNEKSKHGFRNLIKHYYQRKTINTSMCLWSVLILYLVDLDGILMSTVYSRISTEEINTQIEGLNNRIKNYTAEIFNITPSYDPSTNGRNLYLSNVFPSSFIFYTDESGSNFIRKQDVLQNHCIFKTPRSFNTTSAKLNEDKMEPKSVETSAMEEDYILEYDDNFTTKSEINTSKFATITSCSSCQHHEKAKKESLESIKKHILMRLQLSIPPNIRVPPPVVPQKILDYFYKNFNNSRTMFTTPFNNSNNKSYKQKAKIHQSNIGGELRDEGVNGSSSTPLEGDIMMDDYTYSYADEHSSDEFYSRLHSIYMFPTKSRLHYNRKPEIFNFKYNSDPSRISSAILHVYIKGQKWIYEYQSDLLEKKNVEISIKGKQEIMIIIYRALRRPNTMNYTHTVKLMESRQKIPPGKGQWVEIEIKELSTYWIKAPNSTQSIVIRGMESWMRTFIVTEDQSTDKSLTMHIEIVTRVKNRFKRNAALDCRESDNEVRCCRYPLKVNFTNFGWNFIVAPQHFDAYFCNGECNVGYLEKYTHTHITSLSTSAKPCCSPQKLSALALLYFDNNNKLMYSTIPNMSVEKCSCS